MEPDKNLEEANRKLMAARLGESLERDQQSERLQVIEQPPLPQKPIKPNRLKLFVLAFFLATGFLSAAQICLLLMPEKPWRSAGEPSEIGHERKEIARKEF